MARNRNTTIRIIYVVAILTLVLVGGFALFSDRNIPLSAKPVELTFEEELQVLYEKYGDYVQVTDDGRLLYKNIEVTENRFKSKIPLDTTITVYDAPCGKGYQIERNIEGGYISTGFGCEAEARTGTYLERTEPDNLLFPNRI